MEQGILTRLEHVTYPMHSFLIGREIFANMLKQCAFGIYVLTYILLIFYIISRNSRYK